MSKYLGLMILCRIKGIALSTVLLGVIMFYGVFKSKLELADAQCEDSLTSSVFERLVLLSDDNLWWVLRNACDKQTAATLPDNVGKLEKFEFWPSWDPAPQLERNNLRVEPDVFLRFEELDIIVEAKRHDFTKSQQESQREEQWENELGAWFKEFQSDRPVVLLAIGGNTTVGTCEVELEHLPQQFRVERLHWEMLRDSVFELSNRFSNDTHLVHLVDQLDNVFDFFGVRSQKMRWLCYLSSTAVKNKVSSSQLLSALADIRRAYRVLVPFQERMKKTLLYINEQCRFYDKDTDVKFYPFGTCADRIISKIEKEKIVGLGKIEVAFNNDTVFKNVNFAGYSTVLFGGPRVFSRKRKHNQVAELRGYIIPDDRLIMNRLHGVDAVLDIQDAKEASGYIVLFAATNNDHFTKKYYNVGDRITNKDNKDMLLLAEDDGFEGLDKIRELLSYPSDEKIMPDGDKKSILKRYRLEEFADKQSTDQVLCDFAKLVLEEGKVKIFKDRFYSEN